MQAQVGEAAFRHVLDFSLCSTDLHSNMYSVGRLTQLADAVCRADLLTALDYISIEVDTLCVTTKERIDMHNMHLCVLNAAESQLNPMWMHVLTDGARCCQ